MPRSVQGRRIDRNDVQRRKIRAGRNGRARKITATGGCGDSSPRLIGLPLDVTVPTMSGIRWRYCSRWDEQPAAQLGKSLLRLGICHPEDWSGSAVDFVERGFKRFCKINNADEVRKVWEGDLRIMDHAFDLSEQERQQVKAEMTEPAKSLYLVGNYSSAASIPFGPSWTLLEKEHQFLPAAFYRVFADNLWTWMRVYDYRSALDHVEAWTECMDEEELKESFYPSVEKNIPDCLRKTAKLPIAKALGFLEDVGTNLRASIARQLVAQVLEMHEHGRKHDHAWPAKLTEQVPGLEEFLADADGCGPGCVITWRDNDEISACFDEEMSTLGQNGPMEPSIMLRMNLDQPMNATDVEVKYVFNYAGAMLRSLAAAAQAVEIIRGIYDEHVRKHRLQSRVQVEPSAPCVR